MRSICLLRLLIDTTARRSLTWNRLRTGFDAGEWPRRACPGRYGLGRSEGQGSKARANLCGVMRPFPPVSSSPRPSLRNSFAARFILLSLCFAGVLSPATIFPVTPHTDIPLAMYICGLSVTCAVLLPGCWRRCFSPDREPALWREGSRKPEFWRSVTLGSALAGLAFLSVSLLFLRPWYHGQTNWQAIIAAPGCMLLLWSRVAADYRKLRLPVLFQPMYVPVSQPNEARPEYVHAHAIRMEGSGRAAASLQPAGVLRHTEGA